MMRSFFLIVALLSVVNMAKCDRNENDIDGYYSEKPVGRCVSDYDCGQNECSVMGMQRFSVPQCEPLGVLGSRCIMGAEAENKSLSFPMETLECDNVYTLFCPCAKGLVCDQNECKQPKRQSKFSRRYNSWARMRIH